jgi:hypothetical protein
VTGTDAAQVKALAIRGTRIGRKVIWCRDGPQGVVSARGDLGPLAFSRWSVVVGLLLRRRHRSVGSRR